jgi:hypothetical protein
MRDLEPAVPLIRYEHPAPGDLLHLDIKQLGRFSGVVVRPDGRHCGKLHRGWEYLDIAIDDHSRIAFTQILPDFTASSAIAFLRASVAYYATLGIPIRRLLTDNGHCRSLPRFSRGCGWVSACAITLPVLTPRAPMVKPNDLLNLLFANGPMPASIKTPSSTMSIFFSAFTTTSGIALTVSLSLTLHFTVYSQRQSYFKTTSFMARAVTVEIFIDNLTSTVGGLQERNHVGQSFPRNRRLTVADFLQSSTRFCGSQVFGLNIDNCVHDFCAYSHPHKHQIGRFDSPIPPQRCRNLRTTLKLSLRAVPNSEQKKKCAWRWNVFV